MKCRACGFFLGGHLPQIDYMGVSKNRGKTPKMDGLNNGSKPYEQMDDLGVPLFLETPI